MKKEIFWAILIAAIVLVFSNAYVLYGMMVPKDQLSFLGRRVINSQDTYTYVAFIEQARQGRFYFENLYTTEPQTPSLVRPSYYLLGRLGAFLVLPSIVLYHLGRILFSILFCIILYIFLGQFFKSSGKRLLSFAIILTATGWGYFVAGLFSKVADLWIPEANTFLSLQEAPHFILSQSLMLLSFLFLLKGWQSSLHKEKIRRTTIYFSLVFVVLFALGFEHPYDLLLCTGTAFFAGIYLWFANKVPKKALIISILLVILVSVLGNLYQYIQTLTNPIINNWAQQSSSPTPMDYLLGFGFIIVFAVLGLEKYLTSRKTPEILIIAWIATTSILIYSPIFFQRRLSEGFHIPLSILATEGVIMSALFVSGFVVQRAKKIVYRVFIVILVILMTFGTILGVLADIKTIQNDSVNAYYYYLLNAEVQGMVWLRDKTTPQDVILSNWFYGNIIPGVTGRKVYIGHKAQTNNFDGKVRLINKFILDKNADSAYKFLKDNHITYVFVGNDDTMLTYGFKPDAKPYLIKVFDEGGARVYRVR